MLPCWAACRAINPAPNPGAYIIYTKIHLNSPVCPWAITVLQCRIVNWNIIHSHIQLRDPYSVYSTHSSACSALCQHFHNIVFTTPLNYLSIAISLSRGSSVWGQTPISSLLVTCTMDSLSVSPICWTTSTLVCILKLYSCRSSTMLNWTLVSISHSELFSS